MLRRYAAFFLVAAVACHSRSAAPGNTTSPPPSSEAIVEAPAVSALHPSSRSSPLPVPPPPTAETFPLFRRSPLTLEELSKLVSDAPELARVGSNLAFFDPADGSCIVRSTADHQGVTFSSRPILWSPETGQQILVVAARGKTASFVAAWWLLPDGSYRLASTFVILGEVSPIALAYKPSERALTWTSCWQCPGETGHVSVREDHHVVIVQD